MTAPLRCQSAATLLLLLLLPPLWLLLLSLMLLPQPVQGIRMFMGRTEIQDMLRAKEGHLYFNTCDQSTNRASCNFAIDTSFSQEPTQCALSETSAQPWWLAVLENPAYVTKVTVLNMDSTYKSFPDGLTDISVMITDDVCFRYKSIGAFSQRTFPCDAIGDQVTIQSNLEIAVMAICNVEVLGIPLSFPTALGKDQILEVTECEMSSVHENAECQNAFDGKASPDHKVQPCAVTSGEPQPWIQAKLSTPSIVNYINVYNRQDCCVDNLKNIKITVNNRLCMEYFEPRGFTAKTFDCKYFGDLVRLQSNEVITISVCEMQIFGHPANLAEPTKFNLLGCFADKPADPDLEQLVSSTRMTIKKCYRMCKRLELKYFGLQNGMHCFCGASHGKHGKVADSACNVECENERGTFCGGPDKSSVFEII